MGCGGSVAKSEDGGYGESVKGGSNSTVDDKVDLHTISQGASEGQERRGEVVIKESQGGEGVNGGEEGQASQPQLEKTETKEEDQAPPVTASLDSQEYEMRKKRIIESQLVKLGYPLHEVQAAVASGADAVAALRATPPPDTEEASTLVAAEPLALPADDSSATAAESPSALVDATEMRRRKIVEKQLTKMGHPPEVVRRAIEAGPDAVAALIAGERVEATPPPAPHVDPMEEKRRKIQEAQLVKMGHTRESARNALASGGEAIRELTAGPGRLRSLGFGTMEVAWAMDTCAGDVEEAVRLLASGKRDALIPARTVSDMRNSIVQHCVVCGGDFASGSVDCLGAATHRLCQRCFEQHVEKAISQGVSKAGLMCPVHGCASKPWGYIQIAQHVSEDVFTRYIESSERKQSPWAIPEYWSAAPRPPQRFKIMTVTSAERDALADLVQLPPSADLGGRDQRQAGRHKGFRLSAAWRIENHELFAKFAVEKQRLRSAMNMLKEHGIDLAHVDIREAFRNATQRLPCSLNSDLNEVYLAHGTKPEIILNLVSGGLNERFSGGLFGNGIYFAEDIGKIDQYVTEDVAFGDHEGLHFQLYLDEQRHDGHLYYAVLCRVALGHFCRTLNARTNMDSRESLWSSEKRELAAIPGTAPPELFHGLVGEMGGILKRYREFITFHGDRIYPEYLIAYHRI